MTHELPSLLEDLISQIPALQLLQNLGWRYISPDEANALRGGKLSGVILDGVLVPQLRKLNKIRFKGETHEFSEGNIHRSYAVMEGCTEGGRCTPGSPPGRYPPWPRTN